MGRDLKRVPLDFNWPLHEVWRGYINPYYKASRCQHCHESGYSPEAYHLKEQWYGNAFFMPSMTGSKRFEPSHPLIQARAINDKKRNVLFYHDVDQRALFLASHYNNAWQHHLDQEDVNALWQEVYPYELKRSRETCPTAAEVNEWSITGHGHDSMAMWICVKAKCERMGVSHTCAYCDGSGEFWESPEDKKRYDDWQQVEPPTGEGYQLWETVSEGSPISPVFATENEFIAYLTGEGYSESAARGFVKLGFAMSGVMVGGVFASDIHGLDLLNKEDE